MVDVTSLILLAVSFFFVAISLALLVRYRQVSLRINASTDMGRDLWSSLEQRLKKQDERILDMMGRVEVIQARVTSSASAQSPVSMPPPPSTSSPAPPAASQSSSGRTEKLPVQQPESQVSQSSRAVVAASGVDLELDETQLAALKLLSDAPKNTRQLTDALGKSREHTARIMKELFELALVRRNDSSKPFVYQLTDEGSRRLSASGSQKASQ